MFADVSGSTALYDSQGDVVAKRKIDRCLKLMADVVKRHHGVIIKTIGDEIMCCYKSADDAIRAACEIHNRMELDDELKADAMAVRIGIHYGSMIEDKDDIFGDTVNLAARIVGISKARQILTTHVTVEQLDASLQAMTRAYDIAPIKGKKAEVNIWEVLWDNDEDTTRICLHPKRNSATLKLVYRGESVFIPLGCPSFKLGRSLKTNLVIDSDLASRIHAFIEYRRGKYILIDKSANGTYVLPDDAQQAVFLHGEEMVLTGGGIISLGEPIENAAEHLLRFEF